MKTLTSTARTIFKLCEELSHKTYVQSDGDYGALPTWGPRTPEVARLIQASGPEGDLVSWDTTRRTHLVLTRYTDGGENFFRVEELPSPYHGLTIDQASQRARTCAELPRLGDEIEYADSLTSEAAYHDLVRRMAACWLSLEDGGNGYTVVQAPKE